jgi:hypothetical protein
MPWLDLLVIEKGADQLPQCSGLAYPSRAGERKHLRQFGQIGQHLLYNRAAIIRAIVSPAPLGIIPPGIVNLENLLKILIGHL